MDVHPPIARNGPDHRALAVWAAECAEHVLHLFEAARPGDKRPRQALGALREWIETGRFSMAVIRGASLGAHAAAREAEEGSAAQFAARAAGQAVATAHVPSHRLGAAWYGVKAADAAGIEGERSWQREHMPERLAGYVKAASAQKPALAAPIAGRTARCAEGARDRHVHRL